MTVRLQIGLPNDYAANGSRYFITEGLPTSEYNFLVISSLPQSFTACKSLFSGLCGVTQEQLDDEEYEHLFPGIYRLLALTTPDVKTYSAQLASSGRVLSVNYTGSYAAMLVEHF